MTCKQCEPGDCIAPEGWVCKDSGNFYSTGEYSRTIDFFNIHGVSFNQKVDSVKQLLDSNTIQILKVLLTDNEAPIRFDSLTDLQIIELLDIIQSRLSNNMDNMSKLSYEFNSKNGGE